MRARHQQPAARKPIAADGSGPTGRAGAARPPFAALGLAAASLREGLDETFTINQIGLPGKLRRCLATTNLRGPPNAGVRMRTRRVCRWKDGAMVLRWVATAYLAMEKSFRRIMGHEQLCGCSCPTWIAMKKQQRLPLRKGLFFTSAGELTA